MWRRPDVLFGEQLEARGERLYGVGLTMLEKSKERTVCTAYFFLGHFKFSYLSVGMNYIDLTWI